MLRVAVALSVVTACMSLRLPETKLCTQFGVASYYTSHMVFQRAPARPRLWGYTDNVGDRIIVSFDSLQSLTATAAMGPDGRPTWSAEFDPIDAPGPFQVTALQFDTGCQVVLDDVLVGDVWICSGQSNMYHPMSEIDNPAEDLADVVNYPDVRTFFNELRYSNVPVNNLLEVRRPWERPTPANINDTSAVCWLFGRNLNRKLQRPIGLIETCWGGTRIEAWSSPDALNVCFGPNGPTAGTNQNAASALWNAMIHPFLSLPIYGSIWYQGEANTGNSWQYDCAIKAMVSDWRSKWRSLNPEMNACFPFGEVQLAPYQDMDIIVGFPNVRWAQTYSYGYVPNDELQCFFMAVAIDLPDFESPFGAIHPRYKRQIADRLSLAAFNVAYGYTDVGIFQGPIPVEHTVGATTINFTFDVPIEFRATNGFEVCCSISAQGECTPESNGGGMGSWMPSEVVSTGTQSLELDNVCLGTSKPIAVGYRYGWRESPCAFEACPIYSVENTLPAPPYYYNFNKYKSKRKRL